MPLSKISQWWHCWSAKAFPFLSVEKDLCRQLLNDSRIHSRLECCTWMFPATTAYPFMHKLPGRCLYWLHNLNTRIAEVVGSSSVLSCMGTGGESNWISSGIPFPQHSRRFRVNYSSHEILVQLRLSFPNIKEWERGFSQHRTSV